MNLGTVTYAAQDGIARAVLNRPEQMNAISPDLLEDLDRVCAAVEGDATIRVPTLSAAEAMSWGLVNRVAPSGTLEAAVQEIAVSLAAKSAAAGRTVKLLVNRACNDELEHGLEMERHVVAEHMRSADAVEGLRAFAEKRKPVFHAV